MYTPKKRQKKKRKKIHKGFFFLHLRYHKFALFVAIKTVCGYFTFCRPVDPFSLFLRLKIFTSWDRDTPYNLVQSQQVSIQKMTLK